MTCRSIAWSVSLIYAFAICGSANAADKEGEEAEPQVVRVYRVVDLVVPAPSYPYQGTILPAMASGIRPASTSGSGGMGGGMGGGMFQVADRLAQKSGGGAVGGGGGGGMGGTTTTTRPSMANRIDMDSLIEAITAIVEPASWDEVGGPGSISPIGGTLAVRQTAPIQTKIQEFLEALKRESGTQQVLTTEAMWLSLTAEQLAAIQSKVDVPTPGEAGTPLDAAALAALPAESRRYRGQITCFNGQTVHLVSGRIESVILGAIPVVGANVGYQPIMAEPHLGVLLEITPAALPEEDGIVLDLHSTITHWGPPGKTRSISTTGDEAGRPAIEIDHINVSAQQFATSLRLPRGKPVLIGGINFPPDASEGANATETGSGQGLYLVVTVHASAK